MISCNDVNICISDAPVTPDFGIVCFVIGQQSPMTNDPAGPMKTVIKIECSEWRRKVRVTYSNGSKAVYRGYKFVYGQLR